MNGEQKFGVLAPVEGLREDFPSILLPKAYTAESENVFIRYGEIWRMRMRLKELLDGSNDAVQTPDANRVLKYHLHRTTSGLYYLFGFTADHAYIWDSANKEWDSMFTCSSACTHWSVVSYNTKVIATNGVDKIQVWVDSTPATVFAALDGSSGLDLDGGSTYLTAARFVFIYENYVIFGYTTEGAATYPFRMRWCTGGDETDYDETGAGDTGANDIRKSDRIKGFSTHGTTFEYLIVFQESSIDRMWLVTGDEVFNKHR